MYVGAIDLGFVLTQQAKGGEYRIFEYPRGLYVMQRPGSRYEYSCNYLGDLVNQLIKEEGLTPEQAVNGWQISTEKPETLQLFREGQYQKTEQIMNVLDPYSEDDWDEYED